MKKFSCPEPTLISTPMKRFLLEMIAEELVRPGSFENKRNRLEMYCRAERINFLVLESDLRLFFGMFEDYLRNLDPLIYRFLKLQAACCFVGESDFDSLPVPKPFAGSLPFDLACLSTFGSGIVGGHLIGL
ncbi:MAG TPA: hypothetical protein VK152_07435 [Paludibacter sp.]|nr:hypothetical protein [Paludibacter sp.]